MCVKPILVPTESFAHLRRQYCKIMYVLHLGWGLGGNYPIFVPEEFCFLILYLSAFEFKRSTFKLQFPSPPQILLIFLNLKFFIRFTMGCYIYDLNLISLVTRPGVFICHTRSIMGRMQSISVLFLFFFLG